MIFVKLEKGSSTVSSYVALRNSIRSLLCAKEVTVEQTNEWLDTVVVALAAINDHTLCGAAVLAKTGEITIFHDGTQKGLGSQLLEKIEVIAVGEGLKKVWAWCKGDNEIAHAFFQKNGYDRETLFKKELL